MNISKNTGLLVTVIDGEEEVELMLCAFTRWPGLSCLHDFRLGAVEIRGIFVDGLRLSVSVGGEDEERILYTIRQRSIRLADSSGWFFVRKRT